MSRIPFLLYHHFTLLILICILHVNGQITFQNEPYTTTLLEESTIGTSVLTVSAQDLAIGSITGEYSIDSAEFIIDSISGIVSTNSVIDLEAHGSPLVYMFDTTFTSDVGNVRSSTITISITDINDNTPFFTNTSFYITIPEYTPAATIVYVATATDVDTVSREQSVDDSGDALTGFNYTVDYGRVLYRIVGGNGSEYFDIDIDSGEIQVLDGGIDVDSIPSLTLNISAEDGPGLTTYAVLIVTIEDINDNIPLILSPTSFSITLSEAVSVGFVLVDNVTSVDYDHGFNAEIIYSLLVSNQSTSFYIHPTTGVITLVYPLDRDTDSVLHITLLVTDAGTPALSSSINITLYLTDVNDNTPTFSSDTILIYLMEDIANGSLVRQFEAVDNDEELNGTVRYFLSHPYFYLSPETGELLLIKPLDRETRNGYNFTVIAYDLGSPVANTGSAVVNITVLDVNDNSPTFNSTYFELHLLDTETLNFILSTITAIDIDIGTNGDITYFFTPDTTRPFAIDSITGVITLTQRVTYSLANEWYNYTINAMDSALGIAGRFGSAELAIRVHEVDTSAPVFSQLSYNTTIPEDTQINTIVLNVTAADVDRGLNGEVRYFVVDASTAFCVNDVLEDCGIAGTFGVDPVTGDVYVTSALDRDIRDTLSFQIIAYDGGFPLPMNDTTDIIIYLTDRPDTPPQFDSPSTHASIYENLPILTYIATVIAVDPDTGQDGEFYFRINSTFLDGNLFMINSTTGELYSNSVFDRELKDFYQISVIAEDFAVIPLTSYLLVNITILDQNDNSPYVLPNSYSRILEAKSIGTIVDSNLTVLDNDIDLHAILNYRIVSITPEDHFTIDTNTGYLYTSIVLDITVISSYNICIIAQDSTSPYYNITYCMDVQVLDGNFNAPVFSQIDYNTTVLESSLVGFVLISIVATDQDFSDDNNLIFYYINSTFPAEFNSTFSIDILNGNISLIGGLDREYIREIIITVYAIDQPRFDLSRTTITNVTVFIEDVNEFIPYFLNTTSDITISEDTDIGDLIYTLYAADADADAPNNDIRFLLYNSTYSYYFSVDAVTGNVYVQSQLDRELVQSLTLLFYASDQGTPSFNSTFYLHINLSDVNDNPPQLITTTLFAAENQSPPYTIALLQPVDDDRGSNGSIRTLSLQGNSGNFSLNNVTRVLVSYITFDREDTPSYNVTVVIEDSGRPPLQSMIEINIIVTDVNDNSPIFRQSSYTVYLREDLSIDSYVVGITADDSDIGVNAVLTYSIGSQSMFRIDSGTGEVWLIGMLDFELATEHVLGISVTDGVFTVETTLTVYVIDVNDNPPLFVRGYQFVVKECASSHTHLDTIETTDDDFYSNNTYTEYTIVESEFFAIHSQNGLLKTLQTFDRSIQRHYVITVVANNTLAETPLYSMLDISIYIEPVTDRPKFSEQTQNIEINEDIDIGSIVYTFEIVEYVGDDVDVVYSILSGNIDDTFSLHPINGELSSRKLIHYYQRSAYAISILAVENSTYRNTTTILNIYVTNYELKFPLLNYQITLADYFSGTQPFLEFLFYGFDHPLRQTDTLLFEISRGNDDGVFFLSDSGAISVANHSLLQQTTQPISLLVSVVDEEGQTNQTNITITTSSFALHQPVMSFQIEENITNNSFIGFIAVYNSYTILSGNYDSIFELRFGALFVINSQLLDYESKSLYTLSILLQNTTEEVYVIIYVELIDVNEFDPVFAAEIYYFTLQFPSEYQNLSFPLTIFDKDSHNDAITLNLEDNDGLLVSLVSHEIVFDEIATNTIKNINISLQTDNRITDFAIIKVTFQSYTTNTNEPTFNNTIFSFFLSEDTPVTSRVDIITATDPDSGIQGQLSYGLSGNHDDRDFIVDSVTGLISVNYPLNYETQTDYSLTLYAHDSVNPCYSATTRVIITLQDVNDNFPIFQQDVYTATIYENTSVGIELLQVLATDADPIFRDANGVITGDFGLVLYSLSPNNTEFSISSLEGVVTVGLPLDREMTSSYNISVIATDGGGLVDIATLIVELLDVNDNAPLFANTTIKAELLEHAIVGTRIGLFLAVDPDFEANAVILYEIINWNDDGYFYLDPVTNALHANASFDREIVDLFVVRIEASDLGIPRLASQVDIEICITDINDNSLVFSQSLYNISILENIPAGSIVFTVNATDLDAGNNSVLYYYIFDGDGTGVFSINDQNGSLYLDSPLDYETIRYYTLLIRVTDSNVLQPRTDNTTVLIFVINTNDNFPVFTQVNYTVTIPESITADTFIVQAVAYDLDQITVSLLYRIDFSIDFSAQGRFYIDQNTGDIFVTGSNFDFEDIPRFSFQVFASDTSASPLSTGVIVYVQLENVNDNTPIFQLNTTQFSIIENLYFPYLISNINATDLDADTVEFSLITFSMESECVLLCGLQCQDYDFDPNDSILFYLVGNSGEFYSNTTFDRETRDNFLFTVTASDGVNVATVLCVSLNIIDENDNAPIPLQTEYNVGISENTLAGEFLTPQAVDNDADRNSELTWAIHTVSPTFLGFQIHPMLGTLTLIELLDRESVATYTISVTISDNGISPLQASIIVNVNVRDINDNTPVFSSDSINQTIRIIEDTIVGPVVLQINATDIDSAENATIMFSVSINAFFSINPLTGELYLTSELDYETDTIHTLIITAVDTGTPVLQSNTTLVISVIDSNDNAPVFSSDAYNTSITENTVYTGSLVDLVYTDSDTLFENTFVNFEIVSVDPNEPNFSISGSELRLSGTLDAEISQVYRLMIQASNDLANHLLTNVTTIFVYVTDLNDNTPIFTSTYFFGYINEASPVGFSILKVTATDSDTDFVNSDISFYLETSANSTFFSINATTGVIELENNIDFENNISFTFNVIAIDNGVPVLSSISMVRITVLDSNDNPPFFTQLFSFSINENTIGLLGNVTADDVDNSTIIVYSISSAFVYDETADIYQLIASSIFSIDAANGALTLLQPFDRESADSYLVEITITDSLYYTSSNVTVSVADLNDNIPTTEFPTYTIQINERNALLDSVFTPVVTDIDIELNADNVFKFSTRFPSNGFVINASTGEMLLGVVLDREIRDLYTIEIEIADRGTPVLSSYTVVHIQVSDVNDNIPIIPEPSYQLNVVENSPFGLQIETFKATDDDIGRNGELEFFLDDSALPFEVFANGTLYIDGVVDFETIQVYIFALFVRDLGSPSLTTNTQLTIQISDTNDNIPVFDNTPLTVSISEHTPVQYTVFKLTATDIDSTSNAEYYFTINQGNSELKFSIDELTGDIFTINPLDFELTELYELTVMVTDRGTPALSYTDILEIRVVDENDNIPVFSLFEYFVSVPENISMYTSVFRVYADDVDSGENGLVEFSIDLDAFSIDSTTGEIQILQALDFEEKRIYSVRVTAKDNGIPEQSTVVYLHVIVLNVDDYFALFPLPEVTVFLSNSILISTNIFKASVNTFGEINPSLVYQFIYNELPGYINIDGQTGEVYLENMIPALTGSYIAVIAANREDREAGNDVFMQLYITLHNPDTYSLSFTQPSFYLSVLFDVPIGSVVGTITGGNVDSFYTGSNDSDFHTVFSIADDGTITLIDTLDLDVYSTSVFATNSQNTIQSVVTIEVGFIYNSVPQFSSENYYIQLSEALPTDTTFLTVAAVDNDAIDQGVSISYTISSGDDLSLFYIDSQTGRMSIFQTIDRETTPDFNLTILAVGSGNGTCIVSITVDDVNDNAPYFSEDVYRLTIPSDTTISTVILQVNAFDSDAGRNGEVKYRIISQPVDELFVLDAVSGEITLNDSLRDLQSYTFYVSATDRGLPLRLASEVQVYITIVQPNLYPPVFTTSLPDIMISETTSIGTLITLFQAVDPDTNSSIGVYFYLDNTDSLPFSLSNSGELFLTSQLEYLEASHYNLAITAVDSGIPILSSVIMFTVFIEDINNHNPVFASESYDISLNENFQILTSFITVDATDLDATSLTYILSINSYTDNGDVIFFINPVTGVVMLSNSLDYETRTVHELLITARDNGYPVTQFNSVTLTVTVENVNDNAPVFSQIFTAIIPRLYTAGRFVATVDASDIDSESFVYSIASGNGDGLFDVDAVTGDVTLIRDVDASAQSVYNIQLLAFDGELSSTGQLRVDISDMADYCYDGLCTSVVPSVTCATPDCTTCPANFTISTTSSFCYLYSCFSTAEFLCGEQQQTDCIPFTSRCNGACTASYLLCPADNLCYPISLSSQTCDTQNTICLEGYTLIQYSDSSRVCSEISQNCDTPGKVYCDEIDACQNIVNNPSLCQLCSAQEFECPGTKECVSAEIMCCDASSYFCNITEMCVSADQTCPPVSLNIAPSIPSKAILMGTLNVGSVIGLLLGDGVNVGLDIQGEELGVVIIAHYPVDITLGYWQYLKCRDSATDAYGACNVLEYPWREIPVTTSVDNAFVLPPHYRIRFIRTDPMFEGSAWLRLHVWDGFDEDGAVVRDVDPHFVFLPPFQTDSAFSQEYLYFVTIFNPITFLPAFGTSNIFTFQDIQEDYTSLEDNGVLLSQLFGGVDTPNSYLLSTSVIMGLPSTEAGEIQPSLPTSAITSYFSSVSSTNVIRNRRLTVTTGFLLSNVNDVLGEWQITVTGRQSDWYPITSILVATRTLLYVPLASRIRFIPNEHTHSNPTISIYPWDGTRQGLSILQYVIRGITYDVANTLPTQTGFALGQRNAMSLQVVSILDQPVVINNEVSLPDIPYYVQYQRNEVFVIELEMSIGVFMSQQNTLTQYLAVIFHSNVNIIYYESLDATKCLASFRVLERQLTLADISMELELRKEVLSNLGFNIDRVSQDTFVGQGYGCFNAALYAPNTGQSAGQIASSNGYDGDGDVTGLAVLLHTGSEYGIWQYYRSDAAASQYDPLIVNWITLPNSVSETNAFLLRPSDWVRFTPHPHSHWTIATAPSLTVRLWDTSVGSYTLENDLYHANTDPYTTTVQSTVNHIGLFSSDTMTVFVQREDCTGSAGATLVFDACCVCGGTGADCVGCNAGSSPNVTAVFQFDSCLTCGGNGFACVGCDLVPFSGSNLDGGDICRSNPSQNAPGQVSTYFDCAGTAFGLALVDECNECTEGITDKAYNYLKDCSGICGGTATITSCGVCTGGETGLPEDYPTDCRGICYGEYSRDSCGVCQQNLNPIDYRDCTGKCFGSAKLDQCDSCYGGTSAVSTADTLLDQCGICGGDGTSCIGCDDTVGKELDNCGECGGEHCECTKVTQLTPTYVLSGEETYITVDGAGFFFKPDPLSPSQNTDGSYLPLCGGIRRYPGMNLFVQVSCIFFDNAAREINLPAVTYTDQSNIICRTPAESIAGDFYVLIQFEDILNNAPQPRTPINTSIPLSFIDNSVFKLSVESASSNTGLVGVEIDLFFDVVNFEYFPELSCIILGFSSCGVTYADTYVLKALFIHSGKIMCTIPAAEYPCQVSISISINDQLAGSIPQRDFPFTFLHPQPVVIQSRLQQNLDSILIRFEQPLFTTTDISNGCSALFHTITLSLLGNSLCSFTDTSNEYILIQLSTDAMLNSDSELVWKDNTIYVISESNSFPLSTPTNIQLTASIQNPIAVISGPESVPFSGSTYFSAKLSYNCGYKPFIFSWDIRASDLDIDLSEASRKLSQLDTSSDILMLDSSDFTAGESYTLILSVTNSFGVSSEIAEKIFVKNLFPTYPITLVSYPVDIFYSDQELYFYVLLDYPISDVDRYSFVYSWNVEQVLVSKEKIGINLNTLISNSSALFLPSDYLQANYNYQVSVSIRFIELSREETVSKEIFVNTPSPISIISGGDRQIGFNQPLRIDASNSIQHTGLFDWECFDTFTMLPCTNAANGITSVIGLDTSSLVQTIQQNSLATGGEYLFRLIQASSSHAVTISVQNTDVPELYISPVVYELIGDGVVVITARVYGYEGLMSVYWQCEMVGGQGYISLSSLPIQTLYNQIKQNIPLTKPVTTVVYRSQWNELNLFLPTNILSLYQNYTFSINVIGNGDFSTSITLYNNFPPIQGQLIISDTNGQALTSEIRLEVKGFCGSALTYEFYYTVGDSVKFPIRMRSIIATAIFTPPLISSTQSTDISIFVTVYNGNGKYVSLYESFTINSLQGNPTNEISTLLQVTDNLISNQEIDKAISRVSTLVTSLANEPTHFPSDSAERLFTMMDTLIGLPNIPAFSSLFYLDLVKSLRIDSNQVNNYLLFLLKISKNIFSTLENIKLSPTTNFPSPTVIQIDQTTVLQLIDVIQEIPMTSDLDTSVLSSIFVDISKSLVLTSFFGSQPVNISNSKLDIFFSNDYLYSSDKYCISDNCGSYIQFPLSLTSKYFDWQCNTNSQYNCNGIGLTYLSLHTNEISGNSNIQLSKTEQDTIENSDQNITGFFFNFNSTFLLTDIILLSLINPASAENIQISEDTISINFELDETHLLETGLILCLYRYEQSSDWQIESFFPIQTFTNNINCLYTHFTQYAVARLDYSPIVTPGTTPVQTTTPNITLRSPVITTQPVSSPDFPTAIAVVPIIIILLAVIIIVVILVVIFCLWKRKKTRMLEMVTPFEDKLSSDSSSSGDGMYFKICTVSKSGEEDEIGKLQFLPSSRLREIRNTLLESLPEHFEKKAFCFLTKHREQIDPGTENNHFLRIVYDTEVWIRFINAKDEAFRTVFCCCGKIAFFECSRCHGQAYCSAECQMSDWDLHKSECLLLTERKRRQDVLKKTQSSVIRTSVDLRQQRDLDHSQTTPKFDTWKGFLQSQGAPSEFGRSPLPTSTFTVREQPTLVSPDTTTVFPRVPLSSGRPLPPILGTIQRPLTKPSP